MYYRYNYNSKGPKLVWLLFLLILLMVVATIQTFAANIVLYGGNTAGQAIQLYNLNFGQVVSPGDSVRLKGHYQLINLQGFSGTQAAPVVFVVDSGMRVGSNTSNAYGIRISAPWWEFIGTDTITTVVWNETRVMTNNFNVDASKYFKVKNVKLLSAAASFFGNPTTGGPMGWWVLENFSIGNTATVNVDGETSEAIYRGPTSEGDTTNVFWDSAIIRNGVLYNLAGDGIQVALHRNVLIDNVKIYNYGQRNFAVQRAGIVVGGSSSGIVRNVIIDGGTGPYLQCYGYGNLLIQNCTFTNGAMTVNVDETGGPDGMYLQKNGNAAFPLNVYIENTVVGQALRNAIRETNATAVYLCNNTLASAGPLLNGDVFSTYTSCTTVPPPINAPSFRLKNQQRKINTQTKRITQ
ncbi:MAG: right-handed parallel beta-helix repeat-containing protein [Bacteroidetes bacterium]|uniref:right-handed parallel beta-helix repeat-containing protein n=1 Tax=Phnomibacter sp. TaxID=2836217 RepID=UPI002FDDD3C0|nr:right-handed parallel beta-helix repeat-containing protein [Bacteroidota bacterium]